MPTNIHNIPTIIQSPLETITNTIQPSGRVTQTVKSYPNAESKSRTWRYSFYEDSRLPNYGLLQSVQGPRSVDGTLDDTNRYTYDEHGNLATHSKYTSFLGTNTERTARYRNYNSAGLPQTVTDFDGTVDQITYDTGFRTLQTILTNGSLSQTTSHTYNPLGQRVTSVDADGKVTRYQYDSLGRLSTQTYPSGSYDTYIYHPNNVVYAKQQFSPNGSAAASFWQDVDWIGRVTYTRQGTDKNELFKNIAYDGNGNVNQTTTAGGIIEKWFYDALNRPVSHIDGNGFVDFKSYDSADNNTAETASNTAGSRRLHINRDVLRFESNTDFGAKFYNYDLDNNITSRSHEGRRCSFDYYDQLQRPGFKMCEAVFQEVDYAAFYLGTTTFSYDGSFNHENGYGDLDAVHESRLKGPQLVTSYRYDSLHRVVGKTQNNTQTVSYGYTPAGRMTSMTYPSGNIVNFTYGANGLLNEVSLGNLPVFQGNFPIANNITFDGANRLRAWNWGFGGNYRIDIRDNGLVDFVGNGNLFTEWYGYDRDGRLGLTSLNWTQAWYTYDKNSQLLTERAVSWPNESKITYTYDRNGNRLTLDATGVMRLPYIAVRHSYTGNRLSTWTKDGISQPVGYSPQGELITTYKGKSLYDALGRRVNEDASAQLQGTNLMWFGLRNIASYNYKNERTYEPHLNRQYVYDESSQLIGEYTASGALIVEYIWIGDRPIAAVYPGGRIVYLVTDNQSKPRRGIDAFTQQIVWSWDPDAFGVLQPVAGLPNGVEINLRFPGQYYDAKSGLHYNLNRYYNPELGRYMEPDPIGLKGGLNPYAYAGNDPVNQVDPTGLIIPQLASLAMIGLELNSLSQGEPPGARGARNAEAQVLKNAADGARRETIVAERLAKENPSASIQNQQYLRTADAKIAKDPLTREGRRVDHAVIENGGARTYETTSMTASKSAQQAKEARILKEGGTFIRDRQTRELIPVRGQSETVRMP